MSHMSIEGVRDFTRIPTTIRAVQLTDENAARISRMVSGNLHTSPPGSRVRLYFNTAKGRQRAEWSDWIVHDNSGYSVLTDLQLKALFKETP